LEDLHLNDIEAGDVHTRIHLTTNWALVTLRAESMNGSRDRQRCQHDVVPRDSHELERLAVIDELTRVARGASTTSRNDRAVC
jgi:hypothetical protein